MPHWRLFYHIVWATKDRFPLISSDIEGFLFRILASKCEEKRGQVFAINGMPDHVHVVVAVPPSIALSDFVKHIKGASSYVVCAEFDISFSWQRGYGIYSVSERTLQQAIEYVQRQKEHHQKGTTISGLERIVRDNRGPRRRSHAQNDTSAEADRS